MAEQIIDRTKLIENLKSMIQLMEYDGMRSPGKIKLNSGNLVDMYNLLDRYSQQEAEVKKVAPTKKEEK